MFPVPIPGGSTMTFPVLVPEGISGELADAYLSGRRVLLSR
jgi:hypothetical protein